MADAPLEQCMLPALPSTRLNSGHGRQTDRQTTDGRRQAADGMRVFEGTRPPASLHVTVSMPSLPAPSGVAIRGNPAISHFPKAALHMSLPPPRIIFTLASQHKLCTPPFFSAHHTHSSYTLLPGDKTQFACRPPAICSTALW